MNRISADAGVLPAWKNSPIKTIPSGLRRITVQSQKPPIHKQTRLLTSSTTPTIQQDILKDVSSMFDDDGDQLETVATKDESFQRTSDEDAMRAMFASPTPSVNNSFTNDGTKPVTEYFWDRVDNIEDEYIIQDDNSIIQEAKLLDSVIGPEIGDNPELQNLSSVLRQASLLEFEYTREKSQPIDLQLELTQNSFLLEHIQFLTDFDREMNAHIDAAHSTHSTNSTHSAQVLPEEDKIDYERELISKLDHYLQLPEEALHAMVMRQHQEIVEQGLFTAD